MAFLVLNIADDTLLQDIFAQIDDRCYIQFTGDPNGVVAANLEGQRGWDTANKTMWVATAADGTPDGTTWDTINLGTGNEPDATTSVKGVVLLAQDSDMSAGTNTTKAATPANVANLYAKKGNNSDITQLSGLTSPIGPSAGGSGLTTTTIPTGSLLIGNGSGGFALNRLTPGSASVHITNSAGNITIDVDLSSLDLSGAGGSIDLGTQVSGILPPVQGGTGVDGSGASAGQIFIADGSGNFDLATLTAGSDKLSIANGEGGITIDVTPANILLSTLGGSLHLDTQVTNLLAPVHGGLGVDASGITSGKLAIGNASNGFTLATLTAGSTKIGITNGDGSITLDVNQGNLALGSIGGSLDVSSQVTNKLNPVNGGLGINTVPTDGQIPIGNSSTSKYTASTLTAGSSKIGITNGNGSISIDVNQGNLSLGSIGGTVPQTKGGTGLDSSGITDGQLFVGKTDGTLALANITSDDSSVTITNGDGTIDLSVPSGGGSLPTIANDFQILGTSGGDYTLLMGDLGSAGPINSNETLTFDDESTRFYDTSGGEVDVTLPDATGSADYGKTFTFINLPGGNNLVISRDVTDTINGSSGSITIGVGQQITLVLTQSEGPADWKTKFPINPSTGNAPKFQVYAGPNYTNFSGFPNFRLLTQKDLPAVSPQPIIPRNGQLPFSPLPFSLKPGTVIEYPITNAPGDICVGIDGNTVWYTNPANNTVSKMDLMGVVTDYSVGSAIPRAICNGPDGNLYVTDETGNILQIAQTGGSVGTVLNTYPITDSPTNLPSICCGPIETSDDLPRLYFTAPDLGRIYKMDIGGGSGFGDYSADGHIPTYICLGPDDNLYFTDPQIADSNGLIGSISQSFSIQTWYLPGSGIPDRICSAHGLIFFSVPNNNQIGVVDPYNWGFTAMTFYTIPTGTCTPAGICAAPDGKIAFTETDGNNIGWMDRYGNITETPVLTGSAGLGNICLGPDGAVYAAEVSLNQIAVQALDFVHR